MKKVKLIALVTATCWWSANTAFALKYNGGTNKKGNTPPVIAAGCSPATTATDLDINNTRALIQTGGDMWWDLQGAAKYEIPKGSKQTSLFAGALWMGGVDVSNQLKVAGQRFRDNGNDYWTGPLSTKTAEIDAETCLKWDKHFVSTRDQVVEFVGWYEAGLYDAANGTTTQSEFFPGYSVPDIIQNWPAHGRNFGDYNEDYYQAPFFDRNGDGTYNFEDGDYPGYDLKGEVDCSSRIVNIYGDQNLWWVFNDKGNVHTQTNSNAIGMEIRAQAFAFATNDEVNNMTFYNYELINRSTFTLTETYFGQWVDSDLGGPQDDYVGCDVQRGLGYSYNGDDFDENNSGATGYGAQPPAIGVDFFQGPYQDNDGIDNPGPSALNGYSISCSEAKANLGIPYRGLGVGYSDGVPDNERFGMARFLYHNNNNSVTGDPDAGAQYYNYLRGIWKDNSQMVYGGNGHIASTEADPNTAARYMFPDDTDPLGWGTNCTPKTGWNEVAAGNTPADRRFMQSAGPFTLAPGALNNITVGVVWARATTGGAFASVQALRRADDKTQALFDNCFKILNGPDAPEITGQELDKELIIYLANKNVSNNYNETYAEVDPFLVPPDSVDTDNNGVMDYALTEKEREDYQTYRFQGYMLYQVKDASVSPADLENPEKARLIRQCDIKDGVSRIINHIEDENLGANVPKEMVNGSDDGIVHSFKITDDQFATGDKVLVNHKAVHFMALSYAYNYSPYSEYNPISDGDGSEGKQKRPFLSSRKAATGGIKVFSFIPHKAEVEKDGTVLNSAYGTSIGVKRIEGRGNGGFALNISSTSRDSALLGQYSRVYHPVYGAGGSPISIKVIDPLEVKKGSYIFKMTDTVVNTNCDTASWMLIANYVDASGASVLDTITSDKAINVGNEQLIPKLGISLAISQSAGFAEPSSANGFKTQENCDAVLGATLTFDGANWLTGVPDVDGQNPQNWIRAGNLSDATDSQWDDVFVSDGTANVFLDPKQCFENMLGGIVAPYKMCAKEPHGPIPGTSTLLQNLNKLDFLESVDIVFTADKSKWTRCPVIEMQTDNSLSEPNAFSGNPVDKGMLRGGRSVDKNGNVAAVGDTTASSDPNHPNYIGGFGMGWFPGYAINIETGERLNMAFGEDSWLQAENGRDMIWNPTKNITQGQFEEVRFGGKHYVIVFRNNVVDDATTGGANKASDRMPAYDAGLYSYNVLRAATSTTFMRNVYRAGMWCMLPILNPDYQMSYTSTKQFNIPSTATLSLRVATPYRGYATGKTWYSVNDVLQTTGNYFVDKGPIVYDGTTFNRGDIVYMTAGTTFAAGGTASVQDQIDNVYFTTNSARPMYTFNTDDLAPTVNDNATAVEALKWINVVPNPYYAYSEYETNKLDNRIKIINLPEKCTVSIYTANGVLVRKIEKDDPTVTSVQWDLKNHASVPIASGMYIIHIEAPNIGERVLKWLGIMRPVDLDSF